MSDDAVQERASDVAVVETTVSDAGADGGVVSGHALVAAETVLALEEFPAASRAVTPNV